MSHSCPCMPGQCDMTTPLYRIRMDHTNCLQVTIITLQLNTLYVSSYSEVKRVYDVCQYILIHILWWRRVCVGYPSCILSTQSPPTIMNVKNETQPFGKPHVLRRDRDAGERLGKAKSPLWRAKKFAEDRDHFLKSHGNFFFKHASRFFFFIFKFLSVFQASAVPSSGTMTL